MKVVIVTPTAPHPFKNAAARWYYPLIVRLAECGHEVVCLCGGEDDEQTIEETRGCLAQSGATWTTTLTPTGVTLEPGQHAPVTVTVTVPLTAPTGVTDTVRVTASGTGDPAFSDLTTAAVAAGCLPLIGARFSYVPAAPMAGQVVTFTGSVDGGTPPVLYEWNFGDGSALAAGQVVTHTFPVGSALLPYTVRMTVTNLCDSDTVQHTVTVSSYRLYLPLLLRSTG